MVAESESEAKPIFVAQLKKYNRDDFVTQDRKWTRLKPYIENACKEAFATNILYGAKRAVVQVRGPAWAIFPTVSFHISHVARLPEIQHSNKVTEILLNNIYMPP